MLFDEGVDACSSGWRNDLCFNWFASSRKFGDEREIKVAENGEHERARNRRGGHAQEVGDEPVLFLCELRALAHAEAVLLVDDDEAEIFERHRFFYERVRAEDDGDLARGHAFCEFRLCDGCCERIFVEHRGAAAGHEPDRGLQLLWHVREQALHGFKMLARKNFGWCHEGGLACAPCRHHARDGGHHGFSRSHVSLQKPVHRPRPLHIFYDLPQ